MVLRIGPGLLIDESGVASYTPVAQFHREIGPERIVSDPFQKPLTADEIEALLRSARERELANRSDVISDEPLGPGDVQHLRNTSIPEELMTDAWPYDSVSTDELLHRAEHHLAAALSPDVQRPADVPPKVPLPFPPLGPAVVASGEPVLPPSMIGDIELDVTLELGRADLRVEELLALREGSVVTLDKEAGEPIDLLANGKLVARGEVIVVDDKFCVRICEVVGPR